MKTRNWWFTNFNLELDYANILEKSAVRYIRYGREVCPTTERQHHQGFIAFHNTRASCKATAKLIWGSNIQGKCGPCNGTVEQNFDYTGKDGNFTELGEKPSQGARTDLNNLVESIRSGEKSSDDICLEDPVMYHMYGRTLTKAEDILLRKRYRTEMTEGTWYFGYTGVGKSHVAFEGYDPETHYVKPIGEKDCGWWDGYTGQETVIINEYRGQLPYSELLDLMDKWPKFVSRRGREPVPFLAKRLIVTSSLAPAEVYHNLAEKDSLSQLYRRCKVFYLAFKGASPVEQKCPEGNTEPLGQNMEW